MKKKESKKFRLINVALKINEMIIRDVNLFSAVNDFSEQFVELMIKFLLNLFSDYDQFFFDKSFRNLTNFQTPMDLFRMTTLPQSAINSVAQFMKIIIRILMNHVSHAAMSFLNDMKIKKSKNNFEN